MRAACQSRSSGQDDEKEEADIGLPNEYFRDMNFVENAQLNQSLIQSALVEGSRYLTFHYLFS